MPKFKIQNKNITVSSDFIENIMPELNGAFVKVYLYVLMLANSNKSAENADIAKKLGLLESEVVRAFEILSECELIDIRDNIIYLGEKSSISEDEPEQADEITPPPVPKDSVKVQYSVSEMAKEIEMNKSLSDMLMVAQEVMGKPFNNSDTNTLFWFYDGLGFSPEVILMLLEHCVSADKRNMAYVEKVAISWHEKGITTIEDVERLENEEKENNNYIFTIKRLMGINDRSFTKIEENFLNEWKNIDNMNEEMVALAYEYCILQINKLSFPYMNKIIKRWKNDGIFTVEAAEADNEKFKNRQQNVQKSEFSNTTDYDYEEIEKRMWENL